MWTICTVWKHRMSFERLLLSVWVSVCFTSKSVSRPLTECRFCGTTSEFCGEGCQGTGCQDVKRPGCSSSGGTATKRTMGYYESWSYNRTCDSWSPETIDASAWTHLFYAFALIDTKSFKISQMNSFDTQLYTRFTSLKQANPSLKVFISVGGWDAGGERHTLQVTNDNIY